MGRRGVELARQPQVADGMRVDVAKRDPAMTSKELVYQALAFEPVPRVPYALAFTIAATEKFLASPGGRELFERVDNDVMFVGAIRVEWGVRDETGHYVDEFGVDFDRTIDADIGNPSPIVTLENLSAYRWPDPVADGRFDKLAENLRQFPDKFHLMALDFSLYERAWSLRGMENLLGDFMENRDFVCELLDRIVEFNVALIEAGLKQCPQVDGVYFGDDFGQQSGVVMGPPLWRELLKPRLARQYGVAKAAGKKVVIHSCGRVQELFDDLVEIGVDCFNPFQPEVMNVHEYHDRYHGRMAFWGGVSTQRTLPYGSVQDVQREVEGLLAMGRRGGYIISPAHAMPGDVKSENVAAMLKMIIDQPGA